MSCPGKTAAGLETFGSSVLGLFGLSWTSKYFDRTQKVQQDIQDLQAKYQALMNQQTLAFATQTLTVLTKLETQIKQQQELTSSIMALNNEVLQEALGYESVALGFAVTSIFIMLIYFLRIQWLRLA